MKKILFTLLAAVLLLSVVGCNKTPPEVPDIPDNELVGENLQNNEVEAYVMPRPFEFSGGDMNRSFYEPCEMMFDGVPVELLRLVEQSKYESWADDHNIFYEAPSSLKDYTNIYSFIVEFDISNEDVLSALSVYLQSNNPSIAMSEEDVNIILTRDEAAIIERFATEYSIVVGEHIYSPQWIYENSIEAYKDAGISPEMIKDKLSLYGTFSFTYEAAKAFQSKLSEFIGEAVHLFIVTEDLNIREFSLEWLSSHTIQDYEEANITVHDLETLLSKMLGYEKTKEYEWIKSCYDRMILDAGTSENESKQATNGSEIQIGAYVVSPVGEELRVRDIDSYKEYTVSLSFCVDHTIKEGAFYWINGILDNETNHITVEFPDNFHSPQRYKHTEEGDLPLSVYAVNVTDTGLTIRFECADVIEGELQTGAWYEIEKYENGEWYKINAIAEANGWDDVAYLIKENDITDIEVNWERLYGKLSPGRYRINKEVMRLTETGDFNKIMCSATFVISHNYTQNNEFQNKSQQNEQIDISYDKIRTLVDLDYTFTNYTHYASDMISFNQEEYVIKDPHRYFKITDPDLDTWADWEEYCKSIYCSNLLNTRMGEINNRIIDVDGYAYVVPGGQGRPMSTDYECRIIVQKDGHAVAEAIYKDIQEDTYGEEIVYTYEFEYTKLGWRISSVSR